MNAWVNECIPSMNWNAYCAKQQHGQRASDLLRNLQNRAQLFVQFLFTFKKENLVAQGTGSSLFWLYHDGLDTCSSSGSGAPPSFPSASPMCGHIFWSPGANYSMTSGRHIRSPSKPWTAGLHWCGLTHVNGGRATRERRRKKNNKK